MKTIAAVGVLLLAALLPASAANVFNADGSFQYSGIPNPCTSETISGTANIHAVLNVTLDAAGGQHGNLHINIQSAATGIPAASSIRDRRKSKPTLT